MSVFKNIKSLFIVEEPVEEAKPQKEKAKPQPKNKTTNSPVPPADSPVQNTTPTKGKVEQKFMTVLLKAMEANNLEGFDYLEFKQSIQSLSKMPMDEQTRFQSAFAMASTMGANKENLIKTAQHYISILEKEENKFETALEQQIDAKVGQQQRQIDAMDKTVKEKAEQIKRLTAEINQIQKKIEETKADITDAKQKINTTKSNFIASYNLLRGQIEADVNSMQKYLGGEEKS